MEINEQCWALAPALKHCWPVAFVAIYSKYTVFIYCTVYTYDDVVSPF